MSEATTRGTRFTRKLAAFIERRAGLIMLLTLAFAVVAGLCASQLGIDQRLRKLLPDHFPSVAGTDRVTKRLGNQSDIYVGIQGPSREANVAFGEALAADLRGHPDLRWALFTRDYEFFERHALLYAGVDDLLDLRQRVIERVFDETRRKAYGDLSLVDDEPPAEGAGSSPEGETDEPNALGLDETELRERYGLGEGRSAHFETDEGRFLVLKARPIEESTNLEFARRLQDDLQARIDALQPTSFHPAMTITLHGSFVQHGVRVKQLQGEVAAGTAAAVAALLLSIAVYFRSARAVVLVLGPLFVAGVGALGFAWLVYDVLNLVSAFIFAVLLGLGIDFAIHVLARYRDERARGHRRPTALAITLATTGRSTLGGGLGTGLAFAALTVADFQGFAQFGVVASAGLVLALSTSMVVMPAALVLSERWRPWPPPATRTRAATTTPRPGSGARTIVVAAVGMLAVLGVAAAIYAGLHATELEFEYDFRAMGPKDAEAAEKAAYHQVTYRDAIGTALTVAPAVALTDSREQAQAVHQQLTAIGVMYPDEAALLQPIDARREPSLADAVSPKSLDRPPLPPPEPEPVAAPEPTAPPVAAGDDWDADPEDWVEGAPRVGPKSGGDDWDADPEDWNEGTTAAAGGMRQRPPDLDDPRFLEIARAEAARTIPDPKTLEQLRAYDPERRMAMSDRLGAVTSIDAFVPGQQEVKLEIIADIRTRIDEQRGAMSKATQGEIDQWYAKLEITEPIDAEDLPRWVQQQFEDADGNVGRFVIAWTRGSKADYLVARKIYDAFHTLETPQGQVQVAAEFFVLPEVFEAIEHDGPRVLVLASIAMLLTAALVFSGGHPGSSPSAPRALQSLGSMLAVAMVVLASILWLVALMLALGWRLDFFNVIVLPLLIGMAQDDALHIFERWREAGPGRLGLVLRETGGAVFLTTLTTVCGFSGILFANHRGLQSMAWCAVAGMGLALVAAVVLLPAVLWVVDRVRLAKDRRNRSVEGLP
ncbi:MMPL family transporter [Paraliomyxa miuraensis]|uniref:MMPL family transporter n=1 Tax=Paraliomyxa miuraensis TaxID=376150 RepID=UPI002257143C|nr:MMPL family transporter [Paraliomyxa miuraensis]MCX4248056.1 MMPL family transporter [Paraliomyxa miuraensis]